MIARVALREPDLPRMDASHLDADLQLLVGARDQLVDEQARVRNRLHALLLGLTAGHRQLTGALISQAALRRAREGKTAAEARRCLKRHLAAVVYRAMLRDLAEPAQPPVAVTT